MNRAGNRLLTAFTAALQLNACSVAPMTYMRTFGRAADPITALGWGLTILCSVVVIIIGALVLIPALRARGPKGAISHLAIGRPGGGLAWLYGGVGLSTLALLGIIVWTLLTLRAVSSPSRPTAFTIEIRAHQWWWEARYIGDPPERTFLTANELHIPVGQPVRLELIADDVIHSFWIPALAGKTDVIPGQTNVAWIEADKAGTYRGQCTEYCGEQHAHMALFAIAEPAADFLKWWSGQLTGAAQASSDSQAQGEHLFAERCGACHTIRGTGAGGILGPDLTHLMSRHTIGAGTLPNNPSSLASWIANAQGTKPGCRMPPIAISKPELAAITAYVQTLN
jgi:cytochrome c oxidase subunit 2